MDYVLRIKKKRQSEWLTLFVLAMPFFFGTLIDLIGLPSGVKYLIDIAWVVLLALIILNKFSVPNVESKRLLIHIAVLFCITLIGFVINIQNPFYYLWGFRNNFRFFVFLIACIEFLDIESVDGYLKLFDKLFYINFIVTLIQFFGFDIDGDRLGGIFGSGEGSNGFTMIFFSIIIAKSILNYLNHKEKLYVLLIKSLMALMSAALAELKFFYLLFVLIVALAVLTTNFTFKKLTVVLFSVVGVYFGITLLLQIFPNWANWFTIDSILETALSTKGYTGSGDMNRLTSIPMTWDMFLTTWPKRLLGMGLGNCDTSAFSFLNTAFFENYGHLHYNWFSVAFMFLETGIIGLVCYVAFFIIVYCYTVKRQKSGEGQGLCCQLAKIMCVVSLILIIYNQSMRTEAAYMVYFILALPFLENRIARNSR